MSTPQVEAPASGPTDPAHGVAQEVSHHSAAQAGNVQPGGFTRHPLSAAFGDMPADEFAELVRDIKRNGQISDIVKAADGSILDGWHRYRACLQAGIKPRIEPFSYIIEAAVEGVGGREMSEVDFVVACNAHRRHLTAEQRRRVVAEVLKAEPHKSNVVVAKAAGVTDKTVATVRTKLEATSEIPRLSKTTGRDGKARPTKPASKPKTVPVRVVRPPADPPKTVHFQVTRASSTDDSEGDFTPTFMPVFSDRPLPAAHAAILRTQLPQCIADLQRLAAEIEAGPPTEGHLKQVLLVMGARFRSIENCGDGPPVH